MKALCPSLTTAYYEGSRTGHIAIIGSTGSIGTQAIALWQRYPGRFTISALAAGKNIKVLAEQAAICKPSVIVVADERDVETLRSDIDYPCTILAGDEGLRAASSLAVCDRVLVAASGSAGIVPTLAALAAGKTVALANKECVVAVPELLSDAMRRGGGKLIPVDSEHSALFQLLLDRPAAAVARLVLTASGGPFWQYQKEQLATITREQALKHPRWSMGSKITVDSSTLMNKAFELIEAVRLFGFPEEKVSVVVHPQSVIHGAITLTDGALLAHASATDMAAPIAFGLTFPEARLLAPVRPLDLIEQAKLEFYPLNEELFPAIHMARAALSKGSFATAVLHIANECLVDRFLAAKASFNDISRCVRLCLAHFSESRSIESIEDFLALYRSIEQFVNVALKIIE